MGDTASSGLQYTLPARCLAPDGPHAPPDPGLGGINNNNKRRNARAWFSPWRDWTGCLLGQAQGCRAYTTRVTT